MASRARSAVLKTTLLCLLAACENHTDEAATRPTATVEYRLDTELVGESSGLARSQRRDDVLWTLNDSGGATALYAISTDGRLLATLEIRGAPANLDWEDLASYTRDGQPWLLIGDIGDNSAIRPFINFYRVAEPEFTPGATPLTLGATVSSASVALYPDGPRDAESLAVDSAENRAYLLSKRDAEPTLYRFDLDRPLTVMEKLGPINIPRAPSGYPGNPDSFNWTTAMDFDDGLRRAYVGTLLDGYVWDRAANEDWTQAFARPPQSIDLPDYLQIEAGSFARGRADQVYITSEQLPAPLARLSLPAPSTH